MSPGLEIAVAVEPKQSRSYGYELVLVVGFCSIVF